MMKYQVFSPNQWLYPDSQIKNTGSDNIIISSARNSYAACQILFKHVKKNTKVIWNYDSSSHLIDTPEVYQMMDVLVNENTGVEGSTVPVGTLAGYAVRQAPFRVYDVLKPVDKSYLSTSGTEAVYVCWKIPKNIKPHTYNGNLTFEFDGETITIPVTLEVFCATVPQKETLSVTNWFSLENIAKMHNIDMWSDEFWEMTAKYAKAMRRSRQTHFMVPFFLTKVNKLCGNKYEFDFSRTEKMIKLFLELGFSCIEGAHVATRTDWDAPNFVLEYDKTIDAASVEGYAFLSQYLSAWYDLLKRNDWLDKIVQHVGDEPIEASANDYRILSGTVRKFMPGVKIIDAMIYTGLQGAVDIWVPTNKDYKNNRDCFDLLKELGDIIWFYTCWNPGGNYLNRFMDIPLIKTRYLHWGNYKHGLTGYLHWGFNQYLRDQNPFELTCPMLCPDIHDKRVPSGDTHIVYPGNSGPCLSIRLEAMRSGAEDYELLLMLSKKNKPLADRILNSCMSSFEEVNTDICNFNLNYKKLLDAVSNCCTD